MSHFNFLGDRRGRSRPCRSIFCFLGVLALAAIWTGCSTVDRDWDVPMGRAFKPKNFVASESIPDDVRRVGLLPVYSAEWKPADLSGIEASLSAELGKFERFEVVEISREAMASRFGRESFQSSSAVPLDFLSRLQGDFGLDAVLFIDLTSYSPYRPISIGVRSKLVSTHDSVVIWSFDTIFDSAQPDVAIAARRYHHDSSRPAYPLENTAGILQSPTRYAKYVGYAMFQTLPVRETP